MKKKKIISFILCFVMLLGQIPGTAFAKEYQQLYLYWDTDDYRTEVTFPSGEEILLVFTIDQNETITDGTYTYTCTDSLGTVEWDSEKDCVVWTTGTTAAEGQITAAKDGVTYAINATVTANTEVVLEQGFYTTMAADGTLSGFIDGDPNDNWRYTIPFVTGEETTVYYYMENAVSFVIDGDGLSMVRVDGYNGNLYAVILAAGNRGTIDGSIQFETASGGTPGFPITFTDGTRQLYLYWDTDDYRTEVTFPSGEEILLVFTIDQNENITDGTYTYTCTDSLGTVERDSEKDCVVWTTGTTAAEGQITATKDGLTYAINATVTSSNNGGQEEEESEPGQLYCNGKTSISRPAPVGCSLQFNLADGTEISSDEYNMYCSENFGEITAFASDKTQWGWDFFEGVPGTTGKIYATHKITQATYAIDVTIASAEYGVYTTTDADVTDPGEAYVLPSGIRNDQFVYTLDYINGPRTVYVIPGYGDCTISKAESSNDSISATASNNVVTISLNAEITSGTYEAGIILTVGDGLEETIVVSFTDGSSSNGNEQEGSPYDPIRQISDSHDTTAEDICTDTSWLDDGLKVSATASFTLDGVTYYMGVSLHGDTYPRSGNAMSPSLEEGQYLLRQFDIGFYTALPGDEEFARITDGETLEMIEAAFGGTLKLEVKGLNYATYNFSAPEVFPAMHEARGDEQCFACTILELGTENQGAYAISGFGTVNGEEICVRTTFNWDPTTEIVYNPTGSDVIEQINAYLLDFDPAICANLTINIPAGTHEGYIIVPETLTSVEIVILGADPDQNGNTTYIRGGVRSDSGFVVNVMQMTFLGAGSESEDRPDRQWADGTDNIALSGSGFIRSNDCCYTGYDIAIDGKEVLKFGIGNTFTNNNIAVLLDTTGDRHAITSLENSTFINNGIAIAFYQVPVNFPLSALDLTRCCFVDNDVDIWNKLNRNIFMPGCYFAYTSADGIETVRECQYRPIAEGSQRKQVFYYPQANSRACDSFIYDTAFYQHMPVLSIDFTKFFPIPSSALDGAEFTVLSGETELAKITYGTAAALQTHSLGNSSIGTFDATVEVVRTDNTQIDITLQAIPDGKTPTVSVPCDESWKTATVTDPDGEVLTATVSDGYVSFMAEQGGTYTITNTTVTEHNYGEPQFSWQLDYTSATITSTCPNCEEGTSGKSVSAECKITSQWDASTRTLTFTATAEILGQSYTDVQYIKFAMEEGKLTAEFSLLKENATAPMILVVAAYSDNGKMTGCQIVNEVIYTTEIDLNISGDSFRIFFLQPETYTPDMVSVTL